jgi:hypothetical protein
MKMTNTPESTSAISLRRFVGERMRGAGSPLPQGLLSVVRTLAGWQPTAPLQYIGDPPQLVELNESSLAAYLAEVENARAQGIPAIFRLASRPGAAELALFFDVEPTPSGDVEYVWFSLPPTLPAEGVLQLGRLRETVAAISLGFGTYHSYIEDEGLLLLYRGDRSVERARAALPPELRAFVPNPPMPQQSVDRLPELLVPQEFDRRRVPDAIWWINFWDRIQVETVGLHKIRSAGWAQIVEQSNGALVLIATDTPTDIANPTHVAHLRDLIEHMNLRELQERYRYEGAMMP